MTHRGACEGPARVDDSDYSPVTEEMDGTNRVVGRDPVGDLAGRQVPRHEFVVAVLVHQLAAPGRLFALKSGADRDRRLAVGREGQAASTRAAGVERLQARRRW